MMNSGIGMNSGIKKNSGTQELKNSGIRNSGIRNSGIRNSRIRNSGICKLINNQSYHPINRIKSSDDFSSMFNFEHYHPAVQQCHSIHPLLQTLSSIVSHSVPLLQTLSSTVTDAQLHCCRHSTPLLQTLSFIVTDAQLHCYRRSASLLQTLSFTVTDAQLRCYRRSASLLQTLSFAGAAGWSNYLQQYLRPSNLGLNIEYPASCI